MLSIPGIDIIKPTLKTVFPNIEEVGVKYDLYLDLTDRSHANLTLSKS